MAHSQKPQSDRPDLAHVESILDDNKISPNAEYHPDELVKSKFDGLSIPRTVWVFRRVALVALAVYTGYVCEGFELKIGNNIIANAGFIKQFGRKGGSGVQALDPTWVSTWTSLLNVGQIVTFLYIHWFSDRFGRKACLYLAWLWLAVGCTVLNVAKTPSVWAIGKLCNGAGVGILQVTCQVYVMEICPNNIRGGMLTFQAVWSNIGNIACNVMMQRLNKNHPDDYTLPLRILIAPVVMMLLFWAFVPESPWYYARHGQKEKAMKSLKLLYGNVEGYDFEQEYSIIEKTISHERELLDEAPKLTHVFKGLNLRRTLTVLLLAVSGPFGGLSIILSYSTCPSIASQEGVRLGTPIESPVSSPSIWPRPARERHSRPPVQLQQSAIERPVMERRDFELPDPDWMRDLSHCPLSDRDKELLEKFWTELENDRMEHCARCQETWFDMGLKGGICKRCIARDKNKKEDEPWFFSAENQLDFGLIPAFLPQLTIVEEMLIARVHVFVNVMQVRGQQYKYRGHIVHFLRDVGKVYSQLPLLPPELDVILLRPPTASEHAHLNRQFRRQFRVRRRCLQEWLNFLSNNHPGYRGITVCQKRMSVLPEDGDVLDQVATAAVTDPLSANLGNIENDDVEPDEVDQSAVPDLLPEDTEMEALRSHVLGEERGEHLPVRPSTQHQLEMPDIRRTPINEFNHSQALLSLAFPTLFPRGQADFVEPRLRPIKYADYIQHALRWHDGRFARHPTFRFVVFNTLMRAQARAKSSYFVKEYQQRQGLITRDDLLEAFQNPESAEAQQLLNSINRQTAQLRGTRPYWYRKRRELESYAYNLDCPGAFITFSPADLHWRSLYQHLPQFQDWQELPEQQRMGMSSKLLRDNPHIAAWHFYRRFGLFRDIVLKQKFNVTDYWNRYEWQGRGSSHCHGLFWMDGAPSVDLENEHLRKEFARIWRFHVTAFNPEPARVRQQGEGNPLAVNPLQHPLTFQWLSQVLNRCQRHHCSETYCLRKKKGSEEISCRFFFPRDTRDTADVVRRQGQSYFSFEAARNDSLMNHYNRCLSLGWLANIDISPCTSLQAVINYAAKYCSKMEKRTDSYASMGRQILPYVSHQNPLLSFASRLMNKLLTERDFSGQEICHVLLNCELQEGTRVIRAVDCRPYEQQGRSLRLQGDHDDAEVVGIYEKYLSRPPLHEELTYLDFLANWNTSKRDGRKWTRWSRQAKPRVLYYFPRYKSNHQHHQYDDFCRVKLMLAHPHRDPNELRKINGVEYNSYASAAEFCYGNHRHPDDYYGTPNAEERRPDPDEFEEEFHEPDLLEEDWLELARQLPDCPPSQEAIDLLGRRDIDIQYDWTPHVGRYADPGIVQGDYWRQRIEQNRLYMDVEDMPLEVRDALNPEQRIVYDTFIGHFQCGSEEQILLHVDGGGGTGKSYMIKVLSSHLQRLAGNRPSPIWRAAPTGVASNQIMGTTLHSLLRLPMDRAFTELSPADANAIQKKLRDVRYLVIDEKSMLGLRQLSWIDKRLRQVFPARAAEFFGGISIILVGDFFQLPPIANKPLYFDGPLKDLHEVSGQTAYRAFNHTVFLKKVQRQQGDDQAGFRLALEELRGLKLSIESWKLLSQRVQVKLSQREEDTFDAALRIYSKKARVNEYNYEHLVRLKHPAIQVMAKNIGNGADKATSEQAGNLAGQFPPAGLVNGAQGTVKDAVPPGLIATRSAFLWLLLGLLQLKRIIRHGPHDLLASHGHATAALAIP
ncbi:hypothetical protein HZS61_015945 [Fusarium oxysporum f. sp. conglutinans]|uniref:ATP-dependent DNA helicase n=2 Tax=Fusarium oxysporum f. sp. conglutinans TaxID=100902 RepID=A0A8H6LI92_FUSOX|nr:hypothetical protein HZS61_015945 [Fusarium oxysporum f. sp. conglutinans]